VFSLDRSPLNLSFVRRFGVNAGRLRGLLGGGRVLGGDVEGEVVARRRDLRGEADASALEEGQSRGMAPKPPVELQPPSSFRALPPNPFVLIQSSAGSARGEPSTELRPQSDFATPGSARRSERSLDSDDDDDSVD
jgi:hypothetical protein